MHTKPNLIIMGEKPQGTAMLKLLIESDLFNIVGGVTRRNLKNVWWGSDDFSLLLKQYKISVLKKEDLKNIDYDILCSVLYGFLIDSELIKKSKWFGINVHEAPLPRYRGCNGTSHSIFENDSEYGTTLHILGEELDSGGIIDQEIFPILKDETAKELYERTKVISAIMFKRNLEAIAKKSFTIRPIDVSNEKLRKRSSLNDLRDLSFGIPNNFYSTVKALDFVPFEPAFIFEGKIKFYFFINNSLGRLSHQVSEYVDEIQILGCRSIIKMREEIYKKFYPIFVPEYSWGK